MPRAMSTTVSERSHARWFWAVAALAGLVAVGFALWISFRLGGSGTTDAVDDLGELLAALVAAGLCAMAALRLPRARVGWWFLAAASFSWAAGEAVWCYYDLGRGIVVPFPSLADVGFLAAVPLTVVGLLLLPAAAGSTTWRLRGLLDGMLIAGSMFFVSWATVLGPVFRQHEGGAFAQTVSLAYPIGDVVIASVVIILAVHHKGRSRMSLGLVLAGMLAFALADSSFAYLTAVNSYGIGNVVDTGWVLGYLLIGLGALRAVTQPGEAIPDTTPTTGWRVLGPYVPLATAGAVFVWRIANGQPLREVGQLVCFALALVMSARQILVLFENLSLTRQLENRVEARTAELRHRAFHDPLTDLPNRALFNEHLINAVHRRGRAGQSLAVLFVDLDGFKRVNDLYGHTTGDKLLRAVANRLTRALRTADTVARLGGDEFAVLLEGPPMASNPDAAAQRVLRALERPLRIGPHRITVGASIGIAVDANGDETAEELLRNADLAMYTAKAKGGRHAERFATEMHSTVLERMRLEAELRSALAHDEFFLLYQPVIDLISGVTRGVEALIRWDHPRRGLVSPVEFIPAAETTGLIVPIGAWVLRQACAQAQSWALNEGATLQLNVNVSAVQLADAGLTDVVAAALADSGLDPAQLTLEITESVIMDDLPDAIAALYALRALGVKLAIDDFGTGYSSLSALRDLPVDTLKIDRSFVTGITNGKGASDLAEHIVQLAEDFGLHTVAEGVEQLDQAAALTRIGCESAQGFLFSRPVEPDEILVLLRAGSFDLTHEVARARTRRSAGRETDPVDRATLPIMSPRIAATSSDN
jgi:diguanylate cyclase